MTLPFWSRCALAVLPLGADRSEVESDFTELFSDRRVRYGVVYAHRRLALDILSVWRGTSRGGSMWQDLRFGMRLFRKHPMPVGFAVGGLALAIGVVSSVFSIVNATMLRPYGMDDPTSVVSVARTGLHSGSTSWPYATFLQMRAGTSLATVEASFEDHVRFGTTSADDGIAGRGILFVSGGYLHTLGGRPALGRSLEPADDLPSAAPVIVVSHHLWATQLDRDPSVIGKTMWLNGAAVSLVGVLQPDFSGPVQRRPSVWAPFATFDDVLTVAEGYTINGRVPESLIGAPFDPTSKTPVTVVARLTPNAAVGALQENLTAIANRPAPSAVAPAAGTTPKTLSLFSAASPVDGPEAAEAYLSIFSILGIAGLVLAVAVANTANLQLAAAATRAREIGVRLALGASTRRLVRQMVSESLMLGLAAGGLGFLLATWFAPALGRVIDVSPEINTAPGAAVLFFTVAVAIVCGLGAGISPARHGARGNVLTALQSQSGSAGRASVPSRLRTSFIGFQAAVSMLLLVAAMLLARTAIHTTRTDVGFDADHMVTVSLVTPAKGFDEPAYVERALAAVRSLPLVEHAGLTQYQPFGYSVESATLTTGDSSYYLYMNRTDAEYFAAAGLRFLRGRPFTAAEATAEAPLAVISESVARRFFNGRDAIGQPLSALPFAYPTETATIIGVVADAMMTRIHTRDFGNIYRPIRRPGSTSRGATGPPTMVVRSASPVAAARTIEDTLSRLDARVRPTASLVQGALDEWVNRKRMLAMLAAPTALLALVLAALGAYGVTSFVVGQRTQEVSVRMALGASTADVCRMLVWDSVRPVAIGLTVGLALALAAGRVFASLLQGISPHDPIAIGAAIVTLVGGALLAALFPSRRIAKTDPAVVLRNV